MVSDQISKDGKGRVWLANLRDCIMEPQSSLPGMGAGNSTASTGSPTPGLAECLQAM